MSDIVVIAPSRNRPERAADMVASFRDTAHLLSTEMVLVVDEDDVRLPDYLDIPRRFADRSSGPLRPANAIHVVVLSEAETGNLVRATNAAARRVWDDDCIIGTVNDDMLFRTSRWDRMVADELNARPGVVYGNDLHQGERLATSPFMSAVIPRTLGYYALPTCAHMRIDRAWRRLGEEAGVLRYLPDMVIEHMHPDAGKAADDPGYAAARAGWSADKRAYRAWLADGLERDAETVRAAVGQAVAA